MSKQKNRFRLQPGHKPYLFDLPRELRKVKLWAFVDGILNSFNAWPMRPESETDMFIGAAAIESAFMREKFVYKGKQGTNQPQEFRQSFSDFCALIHPAVTRLFLDEPLVYERFLAMSEKERAAQAYQAAEQFLPEVDRLQSIGAPIVFEM